MNKRLFTLGILIVVLVGVFVPSHIAFAEDGIVGTIFQSIGNVTFGPLFSIVGAILMVVSSFILILSGWLFDQVIQYTIVEVSQNIGNSAGLGGAITTAWATLRDVANMCFIFVLLFAAFKAMFELNFGGIGTTIRNIIVVALLINFSLFFSKVVIDASNIVAVGFYQSITTGNNAQLGSNIPGGTNNFKGISGGYMRMLKMQTWYDTNILSGGTNFQNIFLTGFMSSAFMLVSAVIFLIAGVMFAARFIILVFLMIISPLALIAFIIPGLNNRFWDWFRALIDQSFFAPLFFALTWVAFKLGNSLVTAKATTWIDLIKNPLANNGDAKILLLNYVLTTGFFIAALIFAKQMASKTAGFKTISGGLGATAFGSAALLGRQTFGRYANKTANDKGLQERVAAGTATAGERMKLATAQKLAGSSFDVRGVADTKVGKYFGADRAMDIAGKASGVGGQKAKMEKREGDRRKPIDATMRQFRDKPDVIAGYLMKQRLEDQQYMYDKLSARDRAAVDEALDTKHGTTGGANPITTKLRGNMSIDEQEKTAKAAKEATKDKANKTRRDELHKIATDPAHAATFTPATLDAIVKGLPPTQARKLSHESRMSPLIIPRLSVRHLADLMSEGDLQSDEIIAIGTNCTPTQAVWIADPVRVGLWTP